MTAPPLKRVFRSPLRYPLVVRPKENTVTVCIAAACDGGNRIVSCTDGLISLGDVTADTLIGKMFWLGDWQFMYAGTPANVALISGLIEEMAVDDPDALSRRRIQPSVSKAYRRFVADFSSFEALNAFDMTLDQFKNNGLAFFGEQFHGELARQIKETARQVQDQLLVTGWGVSPISAMIYEVGPGGHWLHSAACFGVIGSGGELANSTLMLLGQRRESTLSETLFNVACAKFSSEKSAGLDVGQWTSIYVSRKRSDGDHSGKPCGDFVQAESIAALRGLWENHLQPRIPDEARLPISRIAAALNNGETSVRDMGECVNAANRLQKAKLQAYEEIKRAISKDPQSTTAAQSPPREGGLRPL
jgi:hypothetical protein